MINKANGKGPPGAARNRLALYVVLGLTLTALILVSLLPATNPIRTAFVLPLVLILPGYALTAALFANRLDLAATILLSIGLSIAITIIGGLVLNMTEWGLQTGSWLLWSGSVTVLASLVALRPRKRSQPQPGQAQRINFSDYLPAIAATAVALALCGGALVVARSGAAQQRTAFTEFWLLPDSSTPHLIHIGIHNQEMTTVRYKLQLLADNRVVKEWTPIALESNKEWDDSLVLPEGWAQSMSLDGVLYRLDQPDQVYRHVWLQHNGAAQ